MKFSAFFQFRGIISFSMRILIVEDEHKIANSIKKGLEQESYAVDVAYDGSLGYDLASTEDYDVIVLDLLLWLEHGWPHNIGSHLEHGKSFFLVLCQ